MTCVNGTGDLLHLCLKEEKSFSHDERDWSVWIVQKALGRLSGHVFSPLASSTEKEKLTFRESN